MLSRDDLMNLETYAEQRAEFRARVIAHKKNRQVRLGDNATLYFEDQLTMQYQIQEMLRIERIFDAEGIKEELDTYNPLIPDGSNWKATFMIEYINEDDRKAALAKMIGIEDKVWMQVAGHERVYAIADEDLERDNAEKTSAVHFMRFELTPNMVEAVKAGADIGSGIEHDAYNESIATLPDNIRDSLAADLA
ncbi:MAG: DUF3501 family protein [Gammaproteobacteria bacterium]|nr:DUF3501 family protein [Gammaproteobacteria bacterium]